MLRNHSRLVLWTLAAALALCGQVTTIRSSVTGVITDVSHSVIPNAPVTLNDLDRNQTLNAVTNERGIYLFTNLVPGRYQVTVEHRGFQKTVSAEFPLAGAQSAQIDLSLQVGELTSTVEVTSSTPVIQMAESTVGQLVDRRIVEAMAIKGRSFLGYAALAPAVSSYPREGRGSNFSEGNQLNPGGADILPGGGMNTGFYMNGVNINDNMMGGVNYQPSVDSISEVKVDAANFSAEQGRDILTFSVVTRGGTSQHHGALFEYLQNSATNAWNPINKAQAAPGQKMSTFQRNQFGGSMGGPITIPKLLKDRNKLFYFFSTEWFKERQAGTDAIFRVPTNAEREGDYSALLSRFPGDPTYVLWDPYSTTINAAGNSVRTPIPNNDLRGARINAQAQDIIKTYYPVANGYVNPSNATDLRNYRTYQQLGSNLWRIDGRIDYRIGASDNVYVMYSKSQGNEISRGGLIPMFNEGWTDRAWLTTANWARVFSPNLTNEFIFAWNIGDLATGGGRLDSPLRQICADPTLTRSKYFKNLGTATANDLGLYSIVLPGYTNINCGGGSFLQTGRTLQFSDNVSWNQGNHVRKLGFTYIRKWITQPRYVRNLQFSQSMTRAGQINQSRGGDSIASMMLGIPDRIEQRFDFGDASPYRNAQMPFWGFFFDEKWRVSPKLTLSLGMRYDLIIPTFHRSAVGTATFDFSTPGWVMKMPGRAPGLDLHWIPADKNNFAPRVALAYQVKKDFVVRTGYGIFYDAGQTNTQGPVLAAAENTAPGVLGDVYDNARFKQHDDLPTMRLTDIFPAQVPLDLGAYPISTGAGAGYFSFVKDVNYTDAKSWTTSYFQRYMFELQKGLAGNTVLTVTYLGGRGTKLPYWENINIPAYRTGWASAAAINAVRPSAIGGTTRWGDAKVLRHGYNSFYNAGTVKIERRMAKGLQVLSHYTFSKAVSDPMNFLNSAAQRFATNLVPVQYDWNRSLGRGEMLTSHPHRFVTVFTYETPWGDSLPRAAKLMLKGWTLNGVVTMESGDAVAPRNTATSARDREPDLMNVIGDPNLPRDQRTFYNYFNRSAFSRPAQDVKGNAGWGIIRAPGQNNWNLSFGKIFRVRENKGVEFKSEWFNAFNHTQWLRINNTYDGAANSTFGWVTAAREPRIIQFNLRIFF